MYLLKFASIEMRKILFSFYKSGPGHISVVTSPFLATNKVKLKSFRPKKRPTTPEEEEKKVSNSDIVINLFNGDAELDRQDNVERRKGERIPNLKRKKRSAQDEKVEFFSKTSPQNEENPGDNVVIEAMEGHGGHEGHDAGHARQEAQATVASNPTLNFSRFVVPSNYLIQQSSLPPKSSGMVEHLKDSSTHNPFANMEFAGLNAEQQPQGLIPEQQSQQQQGLTVEQQQQLFMLLLKQQQEQQRQTQQQQQQVQQQPQQQIQPQTHQGGYNPYYPPPYWYNPYFYPPYNLYQDRPSGGSSTSTSCSSAGCTAAAAAGSSTSTSTSSGASPSQRQSPDGRTNRPRRRTTTRTAITTTTTTTTITTTQPPNSNLNSRPNFNNDSTRQETTTTTSTSTTTTTSSSTANTTAGNNNNNTRPFSIRFGKREANRGDDIEEEEPFYDYDIPAVNEDSSYKFQQPYEIYREPQSEPEVVTIASEPIQNLDLTNFNNFQPPSSPSSASSFFAPQSSPDPSFYTPPSSPEPSYHLPPPPPPPPPPPRPNHIVQPAYKPSSQETWKPQKQNRPVELSNSPTLNSQLKIQPGAPVVNHQQQQLAKPEPVEQHHQQQPAALQIETPGNRHDYDDVNDADDYDHDDVEVNEYDRQPLHLTPETEPPSSLQAILSSHHVRTNFLKTPPRTENFGFQASEYRPKVYQPLLTPQDEKVEHYPSYYQELAERFYTVSGDSKISPMPTRGGSRPVDFAEQDSADDRISGDEEDDDVGQSKVESKENPLVNTAVIALKLSSKILDFYKTVAPYLPQ